MSDKYMTTKEDHERSRAIVEEPVSRIAKITNAIEMIKSESLPVRIAFAALVVIVYGLYFAVAVEVARLLGIDS